jgi:hypothetical protein
VSLIWKWLPVPEVASGEWLESFVNAWQETAVEIEHAQKFLHLFDIMQWVQQGM